MSKPPEYCSDNHSDGEPQGGADESCDGDGAEKAAEKAATLPIPMNSIERFHWFDDEPQYPNAVFARIVFDGEIDEATARLAWKLAKEPHAFVGMNPVSEIGWAGSQWKWNPDRDVARFEYARNQVGDWPLQVTRETGETVRLGCFLGINAFDADSGNVHSEVWFYAHHSLADGIGCLKAINDWLMIYDNLQNDREPNKGVHRVDQSLLAHRSRLGLLSWNYLRYLPHQTIALFGAAKFLFRKTAVLKTGKSNLDGDVSKDGDAMDESPFPSLIGRWLEETDTQRVYDVAKQTARDTGGSVSANSVLLGQWFHCLAQWREGLDDSSRSQDWLRVILPMSVRTARDKRLPMANRTAIVQIDRQAPQQGQMSKFYRLLHREIDIIRSWQLEKMFLIFIRLFGVSNRILKSMASNPTSRGISVFTDLGRPFRSVLKRLKRNENVAKNRTPSKQTSLSLKPIDFDLMGPIRRGTPLNVSVSRFEKRLKITLHFDRTVLSQAEATKILDSYIDGLKSL